MEGNMDSRRAHRPKGHKNCVQELRLVLFGHGWREKSSTGNAILQKQLFDTKRDVKMCVRRQTLNQNGRRMIVVNTPDRWVQYSVQDPGLINDNMSECLSMCQPGPHALLLVLPLGPNKGKEWTVEGPLTLLNDHVWKNTIVVFTKPVKLKGISLEDYIAKIKFLQPLMERCGHRYHLLDTSFYGHKSQVEELLDKINAMVENNKTEVEVGISTEVEAFLTKQNREELEKKVKLRQNDVQASRSVLRSLTEMHKPASEPRILIVGPKHAGKSATGNTILSSGDFNASLKTSPSSVEVDKKQKVTVVDTPGWHGRYYSRNTPFEVIQEIIQSSNTAEPNAVLLVLRCDETFTETDRLNVEEHMSLLGAFVWSKTIVLFTYKDKLGRAVIEEHIERWPALQRIVDKCRNRYHVLNNLVKNDQNQVGDLLEKIQELQVFNDNQYLLQRYMRVQERYRNLDESYKKTEIQLNEKMAEIQELRKITKEKDCFANNLMETNAQKDDLVCSHRNMVDDINRTLHITVWKLENAEKDNTELKKCLMEKDRLIRLSSEEITAFHERLTEAMKMRDQMEAEMIRLQEEKKQLKTENECTKMMLQSVMMEVQKHFKKKHNLQRKMAGDANTLELLCRLENEEEVQKSKHHKQSEQNILPSEDEKRSKPSSCLTSPSVWLLAGGAALGAALGAVFGGSRSVGGFKLNLSSAAGAAAGTLLGVCWKSAGSLPGQADTSSGGQSE